MSRIIRKIKRNFGLMIFSIGVGILMVIFIPIWGWIITSGIALIYCGWRIMERHHHF